MMGGLKGRVGGFAQNNQSCHAMWKKIYTAVWMGVVIYILFQIEIFHHMTDGASILLW